MCREGCRYLEAVLDAFINQVHIDRVEETGCREHLASADAADYVFNDMDMQQECRQR